MKPINLKPWEVRAIQSGAKLLVRPIKPQPPEVSRIIVGKYQPVKEKSDRRTGEAFTYMGEEEFGFIDMWGPWRLRSPFGGPGEVLWGRETWVECIHTSPATDQPELCDGDKLIEHATQYVGADGEKRWHYNGRVICYRATSDVEFCDGDGFTGDMANRNDMPRWRPSTQMPLWASRFRLTVKSVRVMRVQEIGREDLASAGFPPDESPPHDGTRLTFFGRKMCFAEQLYRDHGYDAWDRNDWVAVCEFDQETA